MKTVCVVQARMTSTRLPAKVMLSLGGEPVIRHVLRRCQKIPGIDHVVCAVPAGPASHPIIREARALDIFVATGPEHDVLGRYVIAARDADIIMRITADCPLIDPEICGRVLALMDDGIDYVSNVYPRTVAQGLDCQVFTREALMRAHEEADDPLDREDVCPWMERNLYCVNLDCEGNPETRLCLDTLEDYLSLSKRFA